MSMDRDQINADSLAENIAPDSITPDPTQITNRNTVQPFLKWAGGKRWFVHNCANVFPRQYNRYIEPFLGSAAVFFYLQPEEAILGDLNADLIGAYRAIKSNWQDISNGLRYRQRMHNKDENYYYRQRSKRVTNSIQLANTFIYLNRTCFNGIYRVNSNGNFNVPKGSKNAVVLESDAFDRVSLLLQKAELLVSDFEPLIDQAKYGDLVFADPPYTVRHNYNGFIRYNETLFSWSDQERLAKSLKRAKDRGVKIVATNACHQSICDLYMKLGFATQKVSRYSQISANSANRKKYEELIILANT